MLCEKDIIMRKLELCFNYGFSLTAGILHRGEWDTHRNPTEIKRSPKLFRTAPYQSASMKTPILFFVIPKFGNCTWPNTNMESHSSNCPFYIGIQESPINKLLSCYQIWKWFGLWKTSVLHWCQMALIELECSLNSNTCALFSFS